MIYIQGEYILTFYDDKWVVKRYDKKSVGWIEVVDSVNGVLMSWTGTNDTNIKEIYDGDIALLSDVMGYDLSGDERFVVRYDLLEGFLFDNDDDEIIFYNVFYQNQSDDVEIMGNKFENPELLCEC